MLGRPDCLLFTSSELAVPLQASGGTADWVIPIPKESAFLGVSFYLQALTLGDPVASVVATSNGVQAMVGAK